MSILKKKRKYTIMLFLHYKWLSTVSVEQQNNNCLQFRLLHQTLHTDTGGSVTCVYYQVVVVPVQFTSVYYTAAVTTGS